jgi:GT2 family glycosyltransferase
VALTSGPWAAAIVPTLGRSPHLAACLDALRREGLPTVLVAPRRLVLDPAAEAKATVVARSARRLGFAAANHFGLAAEPAASATWLALVNDDAVVCAGWRATLEGVLGAGDHDDVAAVQGAVVAMAGADARLDGAGLAWNRWGQAVQWGHGRPLSRLPAAPFEVFGVSATAALFRRAALDQVSLSAGPFDEALGSYYEDVDLAIRLRAAGWRALSVPAARARHAGSLTGAGLGAARRVRRNRYPVVARALGRRGVGQLPRMVGRDLIDLGRAVAGGHGRLAAAIAPSIVRGGVAGLVAALRAPASDHALARSLDELARRWPDAPDGPAEPVEAEE